MSSNPGAEVSTIPAALPFAEKPLHGHFISLEQLTRHHINALWYQLGFAEDDSLGMFKWMPMTAPQSEDALWDLFDGLIKSRNFAIYAIIGDPDYVNYSRQRNGTDHDGTKAALGVIGYLDIDITHRNLETGAVLFGKNLRRSAAATEAHYLLLRNVFEPVSGAPYRRVAWKNNSLNTASRRAAERLGYQYEGTWRNHLIVKGRSRNSDWLSIIDEEWPVVKVAMETWLGAENFDGDGKQKRSLEAIRVKDSNR